MELYLFQSDTAALALSSAYLAEVSESERNDILEWVRELDEYTWPSPSDGVNALAVVFKPDNGNSVLSINCGGPSSR